jgi:hypothetical protein
MDNPFRRKEDAMVRRLLMLTASLLVIGAGTAGAAVPPAWNSGYNNWWPAGFGYAPVTVQAPFYPASVTAYGPTFHSASRGWTMDYGAGTSVTRGLGSKTLTISVQVLGQDGRTWYTIMGSNSTSGPITGNPLRMAGTRPAYLGHVYRTVATARLVVPNGHAGCSLSNTCSQTITITATSRPLAP